MTEKRIEEIAEKVTRTHFTAYSVLILVAIQDGIREALAEHVDTLKAENERLTEEIKASHAIDNLRKLFAEENEELAELKNANGHLQEMLATMRSERDAAGVALHLATVELARLRCVRA